MPHIDLQDGLPGIRGPFVYSPATAKPMSDLAQALLTGPHTLTPAERELIASHVSWLNGCHYCYSSHGSTAAQHLGGRAVDYELACRVREDFESAAVSPKLKALLNIAGQVQLGGKHVLPQDIERARGEGATDREIHDTVLIAAAFCMYNRYVDGLGTWQPQDPAMYVEIGQQTARQGYVGRDFGRPLDSLNTTAGRET